MEQKKHLAEHNELITAHYDMSALEQDIFSLVLTQIKKEDLPDQVYRVSVNDLERLSKKEINYQFARKTAKKMLERTCTIVRENGNVLDVTMISDSEYIKGEGYMEIGVSPKLRPFLVDLKKNFTRYQLKLFGALKSKYSKRIYKMLSQYKTSRSKNSGVLWISVEELKKRLKLLDPKTGKEAFAKDWTGFVKKVLEVAQREINEFTDINCGFEAKKTGRKFTHLAFDIVYAQRSTKPVNSLPQEERLQQHLLVKFGLKDWQVTEIIAHVPEVDIQSTLRDIKAKLSEGQIKNTGGYTARVFDRKYGLGFFLAERAKDTVKFSETVKKQLHTDSSFEKKVSMAQGWAKAL